MTFFPYAVSFYYRKFNEVMSFWKFYLNYSRLAIYHQIRASSYLLLPKELKAKQWCLNIESSEKKCFLWSFLALLLALLDPMQHKNADRVSKYQEYECDLNMSGTKYLIHIKDITKFEHQNNININVYGCKDKKNFPLYIRNMVVVRHHVNLLYITACETFHYALLKDLIKLVMNQYNNQNDKEYFC